MLRLLRLCCIVLITIIVLCGVVSASATDEIDEDELLRETIEAGRGHRDEVGERDQWSSKDHLREASKFNTREGQPISAKIKSLLQTYRLECDGCNQAEAVAKINAFVLETKQHAEQRARNKAWLEHSVKLVTVMALAAAAFLYNAKLKESGRVGTSLGGGGDPRRVEIEEQRRRAAKKEEEVQKALLIAKEAPSWRENEEKEVWTAKQEKQFAKALISFGGVPAKGRYHLVADKVDGKTRQECLMHHKLQQLIAKEE